MTDDNKTPNVPTTANENSAAAEPVETPVAEIPPVATQHVITVDGKTLDYTVTTGMMPLKDEEENEIEANLFFMAYTLNDVEDRAERPLMIVFNGGPGAASVWLHLGALGPKRVKMQDEGWMPPPPYRLVDNDHTWLDFADLVFVDPVGTGFSRATKSDLNKKFWNLEGDLASVGEFIRLYLTRYERWASPLFLAGESYGTTRAAGLAGHLFDKGIALNGIVLISTILNFQTARFERGNDLPYILFLPTYAAAAWYHKKLPADLLQREVSDVLAEVEDWAETEYAVALAKGDRLSAEERAALIEKLARYTGLDETYIDQTNMRIHIMRFCKELLREQKRTVGRIDSRFKGRDALAVTEFPDFDPSMAAITPPYTAMMNDYVRAQLGYSIDREYQTLNYATNREWEWERGQFPDTSEALRGAFARNPYMKVFVAMGLYDLATPHFAAQYTLSHMDIDAELQGNIQSAKYEAGHMLYLDVQSLAKLKQDVAAFMAEAL
ncbi:S10 family peptidase [Chloroflexota bacterium]